MNWLMTIQRIREESYQDKVRTVGMYTVKHDGVVQPLLGGYTAEPGGPGDNNHMGNDRCLQSGMYTAKVHQGPHYQTVGYTTGELYPRPAIELGGTGLRRSILIHPARGFLSSIGCINLSGSLVDWTDTINFGESWRQVDAIINDLREFFGALPPPGYAITGACVLIVQ